MSTMIELKGVRKAFGDKAVLNDINLTISAGQIVGLVGPNGAGKTTCLQALLGLVDFDGDIDVLGHNPKQQRETMLNDVAYIADVAVLPGWLKVSQAVEYMQGVHPKFNRQKAELFLGKTNIPLNAKVKALSKGMITQLHLALTLAVDAKVLVLDEPTLGLDILTRRQFYSHLLEEFYSEDKCVIITTHQIEEVEHILTDVAFIQQGKLVLTESAETIRQRFKLLAVTQGQVPQAKALNPVAVNSLMGITTMMFDGVENESLESLGNLSIPSLADVFVSVMEKEAS